MSDAETAMRLPSAASEPPARNVSAADARDFPAILTGPRRIIFARLVINGVLQAGAALSLPFAILALPQTSTPNAPSVMEILPVAALSGAVAVLRILELSDAQRLGLDYVAEMRLRLFDGLASGLARSSHGVAMARMMNDLSALRNWVGLGLARSVSAGLALAGCVLAASAISENYAFAVAVPVASLGLVTACLVSPLRARVGEVRRLRGRLAKRLGEILPVIAESRSRGAQAKARRRIERAGAALIDAQQAQIRVAAILRAIPDLLLPCAVLAALGLAVQPEQAATGSAGHGAAAVGLVLLAGLAAGPFRQLLRAIEYRAAFVVARERLAPGIAAAPVDDDAHQGRATSSPATAGQTAEPAAELPDPARQPHGAALPLGVMPVSSAATILPRSLRRNIDVARRYQGNDAALHEIAELCGLIGADPYPSRLSAQLSPGTPHLDDAWRARLALARAVAAGGREVAIDATPLTATPEGRKTLARVALRFGLRLHPAILRSETS